MTPTIIGISGPTSTGKTTLATMLASSMSGLTHIAMDDFYKNRADAPLHGDIPNWEVPEAVLFDELEIALSNLQKNVPAHIPIYSKPQSKRVGGLMVHPTPAILIEGTMIYSSPIIRNLCALKFFIKSTQKTILERYDQRPNDYSTNPRYLSEIVFPNLEAYMKEHEGYADIILDGTQNLQCIHEHLLTQLKTHFSF